MRFKNAFCMPPSISLKCWLKQVRSPNAVAEVAREAVLVQRELYKSGFRLSYFRSPMQRKHCVHKDALGLCPRPRSFLRHKGLSSDRLGNGTWKRLIPRPSIGSMSPPGYPSTGCPPAEPGSVSPGKFNSSQQAVVCQFCCGVFVCGLRVPFRVYGPEPQIFPSRDLPVCPLVSRNR
jgi:hypothetical protein